MIPPPDDRHETRPAAGGLAWRFRVPAAGHPIFAGHFPGHPVLPGVVALGWMLAAAERLLGRPGSGATLHNVKFQVVLLPGCEVELTVSPPGNAGRLAARITSAEGAHASVLIEPMAGEALAAGSATPARPTA